MFYFRIFSFYLLIVNVLGYTAPYYNLEEAEQLFADFITKYERKYESPEEYSRRFEIFKAKLKKINELNDRNTDKRGGYEITRFADQDGFPSCVDSSKRPNSTRIVQVKREFIVNAPDHLDYRDQNLVTEVKNQGECRDCYVFAAIGVIEGMHAKATQNIISLSEQQALDCVSTGCDVGGQEIDAINALVSQGGSMSEQDYPYTATKGTCNTDKSKIQVKVLGGNRMPTPDVETLKGALYQNGAPIAINLFAPDSLSGVTGFKILNPDDCNGQSINHAVLLVGYNTDATTGKSYWIIKNSWGTSVGDNGYFYFDMECRCSIGADGATTAQVE